MAAMQKESGSVTTRDFTATGWSAKALDFMTRAVGSGGGGWSMFDDQRGAGSDPYVVLSNISSPSWYSKAKFVQIQYISASERVRVRYYLWWDTTAHAGVCEWHRGSMVTVTGAFAYEFRAGPEMALFGTRIGTTSYNTFVDEWDGISAFVESESVSGVATSKMFHDSGNSSGFLGNFWKITGYKANLDANGKLYFDVVNTTGSTYRIDIYSNSSRTTLIGHTGTFTNTSTGDKGIIPDGGSGLGGLITTLVTVSASSTIDCRFLRLDLTSGEGASFTAGESYFGFDFSTNAAKIAYFKVDSVVGDQLILNAVAGVAESDLLVGARVSPFPHRFYAVSTHYGDTTTNTFCLSLPYHGSVGSTFVSRGWTTAFDQQGGWRWFNAIGSTPNDMSPNQKTKYAMTRLVVSEFTQGNGGGSIVRRNYGKMKNIITSSPVGLADWNDGRILNGNNWLAWYGQSSTLSWLVRDWVSLS